MATSPDVPSRLPLGIETHGYMFDAAGFRRETVPVLRQQADQSSEPGEQSLNPAGLWRRSQESWHHGAGQEFLDGKTDEAADPHRFRYSKGVDVWTKGQVSLHHRTLKAWSTTSTNLRLAVSYANPNGPFCLHVADGTELYFNPLPFGGLNSFALQTGSGWTPTNATIAAANVTRFTLTATSAGAVSAISPTGTAGVPVDAGRSYKASMSSFYVSGGSGRLTQIAIRWYDSAGAVISTEPTVTGTSDVGPSVAGGATITATAPTGAAYAALIVSWSTNFASGEVHRIQTANIAPAVTIGSVSPNASHWASHVINAGQAAQTIQSVVSNGTYVWAALGTSGLHRTTALAETSTADVPAAPASGQISLVGWANGFLLAAGSATSTTGKNTLWRVDNPIAGTPTLVEIKTHPDASFAWTGIGPGRSCVYAWGNVGGNGEVYKITLDPNTGTLSSAASFATYLPDGETIHALQFYAGGIIMGTGKGVRLGQADGAGNIDYGPLIERDYPVRALEPQGRWCWFGWTRFDDSNSGLGRIDLGYFTGTLTPAWASDLMASEIAVGDVLAAVTFTPYGYSTDQRPPIRVFAVSGKGLYAEDPASRVSSGVLDTGTIRFNTSEPKTARSVDVRHHTLPAGASISVRQLTDHYDTMLFTMLGSSSVAGSYGPAQPIDAGSVSAESLEYRFTLIRPSPAGADFTLTPELTRWTVKVLPTPSTIDEIFTIPIIIAREVEDSNGANYPMDVDAEVAYLKGLERSRALVNLQLGDEQHTVYLAASEFQGKNWGPGRQFLEGVFNTQWQTVRG